MSAMSLETLSIIEDLENECYLKPDFNARYRDEVKAKIEEFSSWFNSIARLHLLRCPAQESEAFIFLLLNLKKKIKSAISEINRSSGNTNQSFTCGICAKNVQLQPWQNVWSAVQDHPHLEETFIQNMDYSSEDVSTTNSLEDLSEDLANVDLKPKSDDLNDFKFNFTVKYDARVEQAFYPEPLVQAARRQDRLIDFTIQRCGAGKAACLLCPCSLISKGRVSKISPYVVGNHASGQRHLKFANTPLNVGLLREYHEFWMRQDSCFQTHQVHFLPEITSTDSLRCHLCAEVIRYDAVLEHILDNTHKNKVIKIVTSPETKQNELYLMDLMVEMYDLKGFKREEKVKEAAPPANKTNGAAPPPCSFIKFAPAANDIFLPPRYSEHLSFLTRNGDVVSCNLCKVGVHNNVVLLKQHVLSSQHAQMCLLKLVKYKFFCEICNIPCRDEMAWDEHFGKAVKRHESLPPSRKQKVAEYECRTCHLVLFGDELSISRHINNRLGKHGKAKEIKLPFSVKKLFRSKAAIEEEAVRFQIEAARVITEYQDKMRDCCEDLEHTLSGVYPNCKAYPFGSRISGLGNNQSDLDVFMDTGDMYLGGKNQDAQSQEQFVKKVAKVLKAAKDSFTQVVSIPSARTPIVKLHHNYTNLDCDVSFRHGLGVENTKFLRYCIELQPITQPFILFLKKWSEYCRLNEHITNYGLALMAVFFLQLGEYLLSVKTVRSYNPSQAVVIDGWDTLNYTVPVEKMREFIRAYPGSLKQLLRDFFFYFSKFDYANQVVCPLMGTTVPKLWFNERPHENLPPEMQSYIQRLAENGEPFRSLSPFCIQDPFDLSHNLTKACQNGTITKLKGLCTLTYDLLDKID